MTTQRPESFDRIVGELPPPGRLQDDGAAGSSPFATIRPTREGFVDRDGVKLWYATWGERGPWLAFAPPFQPVHTQLLKAVVPYLSHHARVITTDGRGNGRSDRPQGQAHYDFEHYYADFVAVLDTVGAERVAAVGISAAAMTVLRLAAEQPERVTRLVIVGGFAQWRHGNSADLLTNQLTRDDRQEPSARGGDPDGLAGGEGARSPLGIAWPAWLEGFAASLCSEPYSTKPFEDVVRYGWATTGEVIDWSRNGWAGRDVRALAARVTCPTLVIHGDDDRRVPYAEGEAIHALIEGSQMLTVAGGGHLPAVRDPVLFNRSVREFVTGGPRQKTWVRAISRRRRALFISSAIGLGHAQRDLAIARELRRLQPELDIDWFTVDPAARYLEQEGEQVHPITKRLANESQHFEQCSGEHDLHAFFALRTMDEIMSLNFMTFCDLLEAEHYDLVIGDEAWDVDYYFHENPELKRQPFVFLTDFVGCLPMTGDEREARLCAERNAEDLDHVARYPYVRDASIFVGNPEDVTDQPFGPGLPRIRDWTDRNFSYTGYALPFPPRRWLTPMSCAPGLDTDEMSGSSSHRSGAPASASISWTRSRDRSPTCDGRTARYG
jgi:pimeloyl-ACP methyl ester carboxylesterase